MRQIVTNNIRHACASLGGHSKQAEEAKDVGCLANEVAAVAKLCKIPASEVQLETEGTFRGTYRRSGSQIVQDIFADCGPSYLKETHHQHWYHVGQHYHHAALAGDHPSQKELIQELELVLKRRSLRNMSSAGQATAVEQFLHQFSADGSSDGISSDGMMLTGMDSSSSSNSEGSESNSNSQSNTPTEAAATHLPYFAYDL